MDLSILLAKTIGVYCLVISLGGLINGERIKPLLVDFIKDAPLLYLGGLMALLIGTLIVLTHDVWTLDWRGVITLFGWISAIKGTIILMFPQLTTPFYAKWVKCSGTYYTSFGLMFALGAFLCYKGWSL